MAIEKLRLSGLDPEYPARGGCDRLNAAFALHCPALPATDEPARLSFIAWGSEIELQSDHADNCRNVFR
jgi:hypothetical protein